MGFPKIIADPDARLDYGFNWASTAPIPPSTTASTPWLQTGETITALTVTSSDPTIIIDTSGIVAGTGVVAWVRAAITGSITFHITTSAGRQDDRSIQLVVKER